MSQDTNIIQRLEIADSDMPLHCPFCGQLVLDPENGFEPCPHTLFTATDDGFEFRSSLFDKAMGLVDLEDEDIETDERGFDGLTDTVPIPYSVKFATYMPAPSLYGAYIGFAPPPRGE